MGVGSLVANTTGGHNTAIGTYSLTAVTDGIRNTAIGSGSGLNLTGASMTTLVGYNSSASYNNTSNEIVIGAESIGLGANRAVIGNSNVSEEIFPPTPPPPIEEPDDSGPPPLDLGVKGVSKIRGGDFRFHIPDIDLMGGIRAVIDGVVFTNKGRCKSGCATNKNS